MLLAVAPVVAALLLTGCLDLTTSVSVDDDRSASLVIDAYPDSDTLIEAGGEAALDAFIEAVDAAAGSSEGGLAVEKLEDRRVPGVRLTIDEIPDVAQLAQPVPIPGGPTIRLFNRFELVEQDDRWTLDAELAPLGELATVLTGGSPEELGRASYEVRIALPGRVVSTNAAERDGSTAIWEVDADDPAPWRLSMQNEPGVAVTPVPLVIGAALLVVLVGVVLVITGERWRVRRKLRRAARVQPGPSGWGPSAGGGSLPPGPGRAGGPPGDGRTPSSPPGSGLYSDITGDTSVALPVGGASWGPPPPPLDEHTSPPASGDDGSPTPPSEAGTSSAAAPLPSERATAAVTDDDESPAPRRVVVVPPGWYPDPDDPERTRFWDGTAWTDHVS